MNVARKQKVRWTICGGNPPARIKKQSDPMDLVVFCYGEGGIIERGQKAKGPVDHLRRKSPRPYQKAIRSYGSGCFLLWRSFHQNFLSHSY